MKTPHRRAAIAVTGSCGFVGANVVLHLAAQGHRVIACDIDPPPGPLRRAWDDTPGEVRWVRLDIAAEGGWTALDSSPVERIIHGAAVTPGGPDQAPARTTLVNLWGTVAGLEYARRRGCRRFVFISSSGVYGAVRSSKPLRETRVLTPDGAYALSKLCAERFVSLYRTRYGLDACSVRLAAPYGPWERPTGARTRMSVIFRLATATLLGVKVRVRGSGVARDWTYIEDVAAGLVHLATVRRLPFDLFNLSSGRAVPLAAIARAIGRLIAESGEKIVATGRAPRVEVTMGSADHRAPLDVSRLRSTGFTAETGVEAGLRNYLDWLRGPGAFVLHGQAAATNAPNRVGVS